MLSPLILLAVAMRRLRHTYKLSQRQLAYLVGCSQSYVAQVERAHRPPSYRYAKSLEELFELEPGAFTNCRFLRGRPPLTDQSKLVRRELSQAQPINIAFDFPEKRPRRPRPNVAYGLENPFASMRPGTLCGDQLSRLESLMGQDERFWRQANSVPFDSFTEKRFLIRLALLGAQLTGVGYNQLGSQLQMVCGKKGKPYRGRAPAAFLLKVGELSVALHPQRCVRTERGHRWPDYLVVAAHRGRKLTAVLEINGPDWHRSEARESSRERELGVPVYRMCASLVDSPDILSRFFDWLLGQFQSA
ncbi:helix-turn-helix transcriptional regulator [bacterium]|nr:helix-turn-helix transcriptional regulator [bacterium]